MKRFLGFALIVTMLMGLASCYTHRRPHGHLPPGQAKKIYGGKSAKRYAPGQRKKRHHKPGRGKGNYKHHHEVYLFRVN